MHCLISADDESEIQARACHLMAIFASAKNFSELLFLLSCILTLSSNLITLRTLEVFNQNLLYEFGKLHSDARKPLAAWLAIARSTDCSNLVELKSDFPSCDYIPKSRYCFNIKVNAYRLLVSISFQQKRITILDVFTHAEYSKISPLRTK